jgi:hypothetical protein
MLHNGKDINGLFINFKGTSEKNFLNRKIYRYFQLDDLIRSLTEKKFFLKKPHLWNDPFENIFLRSKVLDQNGNLVDFSLLKEQTYAQCWTLKKESDLMWGNYVKKNRGAIIVTTLGKLINIVAKQNMAFLGLIKYLPEDKILEFFKKQLPFNINSVPILQSLLIKRVEFEEEKEVRIVYFDFYRNQDSKNKVLVWNRNLIDYQSDYAFMPFAPDELIEDIILHPGMTKRMVQIFKKRLHLVYGGKVYKSSIYDIPDITIQIDTRTI